MSLKITPGPWYALEMAEAFRWAMRHVENVFALATHCDREWPQLEAARALLAKLEEP